MGAVDVERQALNVFRMRLLGAEVVPVESGSATLKDAINEALRDWVATRRVRRTTASARSSARTRTRGWCASSSGSSATRRASSAGSCSTARDPDYVVACVGGGSNAIGTFAGLRRHPTCALVGVEAGGHGLETGQHGASVEPGRARASLHGARSLFLQDEDGQILEAHSISAGLDYPGVGPEHAAARGRRAGPSTARPPTRRRSTGFQLLAADRGHRAGARARARDRLAGPRGGRSRSRPARRCWSRCRAGATRTPSRSPSASGTGAVRMNLEAHAAGPARRGPQAARART